MKVKIDLIVDIPSELGVSFDKGVLTMKKDGKELSRDIAIPGVKVAAAAGEVKFVCEKGGKRERTAVNTSASHVRNMIAGFEEEYVYNLEACNVHFPMTLKLEGSTLIVNNFLGEKVPRTAVILPNVEVVVKGSDITVTSIDKEAAGQTAANFELATKINNRDRRIFQDGIYITHKPGWTDE